MTTLIKTTAVLTLSLLCGATASEAQQVTIKPIHAQKVMHIKYQNLIFAPKPWPAEALYQALKAHPEIPLVHMTWYLKGIDFHHSVSFRYNRDKQTAFYDLATSGYFEGKLIEDRDSLRFTNVTLAALQKVANISQKSDTGSTDSHFFKLVKYGCSAYRYASPKKLSYAEISAD